MGRGERESEAPDRLRGEPSCGLVRDMSGVVVENDLNGGIGGGGGVEELVEDVGLAAGAGGLYHGTETTGGAGDPRPHRPEAAGLGGRVAAPAPPLSQP